MDHHFVPVFLLRQWTVGSSDGRLQTFRLDLPHAPTKRFKPKATGYEPDLFALTKPTVAGVDQQAVETRLLQAVDDTAATARQKLDTEGLQSLSLQQRVHWVRFLMSLRVRRPPFVDHLKREATEILRKNLAADPEEYESVRGNAAEATLEEWAEAKFPGLVENIGMASMFSKLVLNPKIGNRLLNLRWWLLDLSPSGRDLLLADDPLIFLGGIDQPGLIVALPISPNKLFLLTKNPLNEMSDRTLVELVNGQSILNARTWLYARDDSHQRFILNRMRLRE